MGSLELEGSDEEGIAKRLWNKFKNERALALYSPFVVCLASGALNPDSFLQCISQNVLLSSSFCSGYELAEEYADDEEYKEAIVKLRKRVLKSFISKEIQALLNPDDTEHIYKKWLNSLSSQKFEASASSIEDLLDKLSISLTGEELDVVERLYHRAMKLELEFIWSQPVLQQTIVPFSRMNNSADNLIIFCDFDLTCTAIDSSALLAELAIVAATNVSEPSVPSTGIRTTWSNLFEQYVEEYRQCMESIVPSEADGDKSPQGNENVFNVHSNDLVYQDSISTGEMIRKMDSPMDKLRAFNNVINCSSNSVKPKTVYIGGSVGDLLCLLEADVGIIGSSSSLTRLGNRFGISFVPLFPGLVTKHKELAETGSLIHKGPSNVLYTVSNWDEIYAFVLGQ
ncbi:UNVERIFIED_CONTAM: Bifunctional protein, mitochondrial [Sesamum radiatum]|uniref:Bifunctional protein, mitochondrial n=1 Tax=Sesamum radiatum TaxID=300843 RepID=A0AAW2W6M7_SESRA